MMNKEIALLQKTIISYQVVIRRCFRLITYSIVLLQSKPIPFVKKWLYTYIFNLFYSKEYIPHTDTFIFI